MHIEREEKDGGIGLLVGYKEKKKPERLKTDNQVWFSFIAYQSLQCQIHFYTYTSK